MSDNPRIDPCLTVLQLDTAFPRIAGDVAARETYVKPISVVPVDCARVADIVSATPDETQIVGFEKSVQKITTGIGVTSCGFLGYWQEHLSSLCPRPFLSSSLIGLGQWQELYAPHEMAIVTFDAESLRAPYYDALLAGFEGMIIGLDSDMHLWQVIAEDLPELDPRRACDEILDLLTPYLRGGGIKALVLECTNLPPYKSAIIDQFDVAVYDILTLIDAHQPDLVNPRFLS